MTHHGALRDAVQGFDVIDCTECGFAHVMPLPSPADLAPVYTHEYYAREKPDYLSVVRKDLSWYEIGYRERFDTFEQFLPPDRRRVLDVGCGPGFFLAHGAGRGWRAMGVEPSTQAAAHARSLGVDIVEEFFDAPLARRLGPVDVVQMTNVLEHVPDPLAFIGAARDALQPGGLLSICVPNDYNPFQDALRNGCGFAPWWVAPPHHLNHFTFDSLATVLERTGFDIAERNASFPIDLFLLMGDNYVGDPVLGRACHEKRMRFEQTMAGTGHEHLRRQFYRSLAALGLGREIIMIARMQ